MFTYRGRIEPGSVRHSSKNVIEFAYNEWTQRQDIPRYAATVASIVRGYAPGEDCQGRFMPYQNCINNNCYAYACCIATSTYPQPGRASRGSVDLNEYVDNRNFTSPNIQSNAQLDGLIPVGTQLPDPLNPPVPGHLVALLFSSPVSNIGGDPQVNWPGDYHWVRCDDAVHFAKWSQKDGGGQVTDYDFAGHPITDPKSADWCVNNNEFVARYDFVCFMWVPDQGTHII